MSKLLSQAAVSVVSWKDEDEEHPAVSERERALAGEAGAVADRANPFFESTARPEREREIRTEVPDTGTLVAKDPAPWSRDFKAFACATTSPATLLRYFDALYGNEDSGARDFSATLTTEDGNVALTARSSDLVLVLSALAASDSDEVASETASRRLGELRASANLRSEDARRPKPRTALLRRRGSPKRENRGSDRWAPPPRFRKFLSASEARLDETACEAAVAALCRFAARDARQFLREANVGYRLRRVLRHCEHYGAFEAQALVLERMGRGREAVSVCVSAYAAHLEQATRDAGDAGPAAFKAETDDVVAVAVGACFREFAASTSAPCLWTQLLNGLARHLRSSAERSGAVRGVEKPHPRRASRGADGLPARPPTSTSSPARAAGALRRRRRA